MGDPFRKINAGDEYPTSAAYRNAVVEMVRWWKNQGGARGVGRKLDDQQQASIIDCKNISGIDLPRFSALAIASVFPDPADNAVAFANGPVLRGITPTESTEPSNFCVLLEPAKANAIVPACISGACVARVFVHNIDDTTCGIGTTTILQSGQGGAEIIWKAAGTGLRWAVIRIGSGGGATRDLTRIMMQESIAPFGYGKGYKLRWDSTASDWIPDIKYLQGIYLNGSDHTYIHVWDTGADGIHLIEAGDAGKMLEIRSDEGGWNADDYQLESVRTRHWSDLAISPSDHTAISSAAQPFIDLDIGAQIRIADIAGFSAGLQQIGNVVDGVAYLSGSAGTAGSTGGSADLIPMGKLSSSPGEADSTGGSGILGAITIHEVLGKFRAWGLDDLGDPINHLVIHAMAANTISNTGTAFTPRPMTARRSSSKVVRALLPASIAYSRTMMATSLSTDPSVIQAARAAMAKSYEPNQPSAWSNEMQRQGNWN